MSGAAAPARGRLIVVSGPSGSGKTTICDALEREYGVEFATTATTRAPRPGEKDGVDYFFLSLEEFQRRIAKGEFLEHATVHGQLYGTPRASVERVLERGGICVLEIDTQGAESIRRSGIPHASLFITVPSIAVLEARLAKRPKERGLDLKTRLERAREEMAMAGRYDHVVTNDDAALERTVAEAAHALGLERKASA